MKYIRHLSRPSLSAIFFLLASACVDDEFLTEYTPLSQERAALQQEEVKIYFSNQPNNYIELGIITVSLLTEAEALDKMKLVASRRGANAIIYLGEDSEIYQNSYTGQLSTNSEYRGLAIFIPS